MIKWLPIWGWTLTFLALSSSASWAEMACPPPPTQIARDILVDTEASASALAKLGTISTSNKTRVIANNLYEKHPNSDKIVIAQLLVSTTCEIIKSAKNLDDTEKLKSFQILSSHLLEERPEIARSKQITTRAFEEKRQSKKILEFVKVVFGTKSPNRSYDVIFTSGPARLYNVGYKNVSLSNIKYRCGEDYYNSDVIIYPEVRVSGYSDSDRFVNFYETPIVDLLSKWTARAKAYISKKEESECQLSINTIKIYKFSFNDIDGKEYNIYHRLSLDFGGYGAPSGELSTTNQDDWDTTNRKFENIKRKINITITEMSDSYLRDFFRITKQINSKSIFD